jgi:hypothetical protein
MVLGQDSVWFIVVNRWVGEAEAVDSIDSIDSIDYIDSIDAIDGDAICVGHCRGCHDEICGVEKNETDELEIRRKYCRKIEERGSQATESRRYFGIYISCVKS